MVALHRRNATSRFSCLFIFRFAANMGSFFVTMDLGRLRGFTDGGAVGRCFFPDFGANLMRSVIPADTGLVQMCISSFGIGIRIRRLPSSIASHRGESSGKKLNLFSAVFFFAWALKFLWRIDNSHPFRGMCLMWLNSKTKMPGSGSYMNVQPPQGIHKKWRSMVHIEGEYSMWQKTFIRRFFTPPCQFPYAYFVLIIYYDRWSRAILKYLYRILFWG